MTDTYEQALKDAVAALNALADKAFHAVLAVSMDSVGYDAYDFAAHRAAVDRHTGVCHAVLEMYELIDRYRNDRRAGAA